VVLLGRCQWHFSHSFVICQPRKVAAATRVCDNGRVQPAVSTRRLNRGQGRTSSYEGYFSRVYANGNNGNGESATAPTSVKVGIIGAGSIAFGTASLVAMHGHHPILWSPSGAGTAELRMDKNNGAEESEIQSTGALIHDFPVQIARSARELVQLSDGVLVVALPANGHGKVMEELAPEIAQFIVDLQYPNHQKLQQEVKKDAMMHIIISSHASLGAVYFIKLLQDERHKHMQSRGFNVKEDGTENIGVKITAWGTTAITARKTSGTTVNVLTVRQAVDFCTVPSNNDDDLPPFQQQQFTMNMISSMTKQELLSDGYSLCTALFGQRFNRRKGGLLAISLSNLNAQNHLGIVLGNMSRMDPPPPPIPISGMDDTKGVGSDKTAATTATTTTTPEPWYQGKNITPLVGRLMEALDRERLDIANALDIQVRTIFEHYSWSFHVPMETDNLSENNEEGKTRSLTISEMNQQMHYYLGNDVLGPTSPDSRYVLEDVPYGLVLTVILGRLVGRPAILHESGINILSAMYGRDFMVENEMLSGLGLLEGEGGDIPSLEKWREMAFLGYFREEEVVEHSSVV